MNDWGGERLGEGDVGEAFTLVPAHKTPGTCEKSGQRHAEAMEGDGQGKGKLRNF